MAESSKSPARELESGRVGTQSPPQLVRSSKDIHPAFYIALWMLLSSAVILFNKWILSTVGFAMFLTTWHMVFATVVTQILARFTSYLDARHSVPMTAKTYIQAIVPIGVLFSLTLICGNLAYIYLSVSFIQMLKASNAVVTLLATWAFRIAPPNLHTLANVSLVVVGIGIASVGEIKFDWTGFSLMSLSVVFEALRLVLIQQILSSPEFKMDPVVSLYYYAPACAAINGCLTLMIEIPKMSMNDIYHVGFLTLLVNGLVAFALNVSVVLLIGKTSAVAMTLSGVLKDIVLVFASIFMFRDPVTAVQFGGYSIALGGLVYYRLGREKVQAMFGQALSTLARRKR